VSKLLRIETHEISGGLDEPRKVRVVTNDGRSETYDYPEELRLTNIDAHEHCIVKLVDLFNEALSFYHVGQTATGHQWTAFMKG
jgi:hypothetical protein